MNDPREILAQMTLEEKAAICDGADFWHLKGMEKYGFPSIMVCDGPHGLRKQDDAADNLGINDSIVAICFPSAAGLAASFDTELMKKAAEKLWEQYSQLIGQKFLETI